MEEMVLQGLVLYCIKKISNYGRGKNVNTYSDFVMTYFPQK